MKKEHFYYPSNDGKTQIHAICWEPEREVRAVLQISHGMVEYIDRYDEFAAYLADRGIAVVGNDHLGHGESVQGGEEYGYFAEKDGNRILLRDLHKLQTAAQKRFPGVPYVLLGHSMGSFLARQYLCIYGEELAGAVIMGTGCQPRLLAGVGMALCRVMAVCFGWHYRSRLIDSMAFGGYNRKFGPLTGRGWLSRNPENVDKYERDKWCTFRFTLNGYYNLFHSLYKLTFTDYIEKMPKELPVFFVAGADDPVGDFGRGVQKVCRQFEELGMKNVSCKLYPDDRHEILNELDREIVYEDISRWLDHVVNKPKEV